MKTSMGFQDGHIWYSSAWSNFTCVQRVSCCFSLLLCTMLTSIMFCGVPKDPAERKMDLGSSYCHDSEEKVQGLAREVGPSALWKNGAYGQRLYLQLEHVEQELRLVLGFAAFFALVLKHMDDEEKPMASLQGHLSNPGVGDQGFLWLLLAAYGQRDPSAYHFNRHLKHSFTQGFSAILGFQEVFTWANTTLVRNLYSHHPGFITDGNSKLVGSAQIRQGRVRENSCPLAPWLQTSLDGCHAPYTLDVEDLSDDGEGWNASNLNSSNGFSQAWQYQSQSQREVIPSGSNSLCTREEVTWILQYLSDNTWLDSVARAVFVEFAVYNANVNLPCIITLTLETSALGTFFAHTDLQSLRLYPFTDGWHPFVVVAEVIYLLFLFNDMTVQGRLMRTQKWCYFHSKWNLLVLATTLASGSALAVFVKRVILAERDICQYRKHGEEGISFSETAAADAVLGYIIAFLVLLSTVKLWHLLRLNPKMNMITSALCCAWRDISSFDIIILIMLLVYSIALLEEKEIVNLLLMKILSFLGIKCRRQEPGSYSEQPELLSEAKPLNLHQLCPRFKLFIYIQSSVELPEGQSLRFILTIDSIIPPNQ
uniref:Uncharacterized protein n=1 Tax=Molossus molossus TaxID=27622 RepID=A0A7J8C8V0_MOLMO|nr:hypothetical protein HJG59_009931 [Molossus molossus]